MKTSFPSIEPLEARIAPATLIVTSLADNGPGTLRAALLTANMTPATVDTVIFKLPPAPAHGENVISLTSGSLFSVGNVNIVGPGAGKLVIDAQSNSRVLDISDDSVAGRGAAVDSPVSITGLTFAGGSFAGPGAGIYSTESLTLKSVVISGNTSTGTVNTPYGGGLAVIGNPQLTKVSVADSIITGNKADEAGGMFIRFTKSITLDKTVISTNLADTSAGGAYLTSPTVPGVVTVSGCTITGNSVASSGTAGGLLIGDGGATTISATRITGNSGGIVGGGFSIIGHQGKTLITGSVISANSAQYAGAGIAVNANGIIQTGAIPISLTISRSTISGNQTTVSSGSHQGGGGIYIAGPSSAAGYLPVSISSTVISSNISAHQGGGILMTHGVAATLSACTISGNTAAGDGGGVAGIGAGASRANITVKGGVISGNSTQLATGDGGGFFENGDGFLSITSAQVTDNAAADGGGIFSDNSLGSTTLAVTLKNVTATNNAAAATGGAISLQDPGTDFSITGGSMKSNSAAYGGAIFNDSAKGAVTATTISGNIAVMKGGGIYSDKTSVSAPDFTVQIAKVTGNTAPQGSNVYGPMTYV